MVIKRIGPLSLAKISGTLYALLGLFAGAIFSMIAMVGGFGADSSERSGFGVLIGAGAIVLFPILYGAVGFVVSLLAALLYNALAGFVGGIEIDVSER